MTTASVEFPTVPELKARRGDLLREAGMTIDELLDGEFKRTLDMNQYIILDEIRGIEFLLED